MRRTSSISKKMRFRRTVMLSCISSSCNAAKSWGNGRREAVQQPSLGPWQRTRDAALRACTVSRLSMMQKFAGKDTDSTAGKSGSRLLRRAAREPAGSSRARPERGCTSQNKSRTCWPRSPRQQRGAAAAACGSESGAAAAAQARSGRHLEPPGSALRGETAEPAGAAAQR